MTSERVVAMPVVWSERHRGHAPKGGYWLGVRLPGDEEPERGDALLAGLGPVDLRQPGRYGPEPIEAVHDPALLRFLDGAHAAWVAAGHPGDPGQSEVVPYVVPRGRVIRPATTVRAEAGRFMADTMTLISAGTADAARAAAECALTAADLVASGRHRAAYAAVRPPGHHAGPDWFGGSCYLNNAAIAARRLVDQGRGPVALVDIDAHHGNGTQELFWTTADVHYLSLHVNPAAGWYPHYCGHADETGDGPGRGANHNAPLAPGTGDDGWLAALAGLIDRIGAHHRSLVVSLGVDAAAGDPESPLEVTASGFARAGALLAGPGLPTVFVQEGGYDLNNLGPLVRAVLAGFEAAARKRDDGRAGRLSDEPTAESADERAGRLPDKPTNEATDEPTDERIRRQARQAADQLAGQRAGQPTEQGAEQ